MELTNEILEQLRKPFKASEISFKCQTKPNEKGNSLVVAYIDARNVMERLDAVVGGEWSDRYEKAGTDRGLVCYLTVCGVTRADVGDDDNDNEAVKSAYSDAFKRAAVKFGIGRFLYDLPKMWATAKPVGKSFVIEEGELARLHRSVDDFLAGKRPAPKAEAPKVAPKSEPKQTTDRPYPAEQVKAKITEKAFALRQQIVDGKLKFQPSTRQVLAAHLTEIFPDDTQRYETTAWLADKASTKDMSPEYVLALMGWLGVKNFDDTLIPAAVQEARACHAAALVAKGQVEMPL